MQAKAVRRYWFSTADDRKRGSHIPGRPGCFRHARHRHRRGLQSRLLQGEARARAADAQPRHQRDLHRHDRALALRVERRAGEAVGRPRPLRRHFLPGRRGAALHERHLERAGQGAPADVHHRRRPAASRIYPRSNAPLRRVRQSTRSTAAAASSRVAAHTPRHSSAG